MIGVFSRRENSMERLAVRNTWAEEMSLLNRSAKLVFVIGDRDCNVHPQLRLNEESCWDDGNG